MTDKFANSLGIQPLKPFKTNDVTDIDSEGNEVVEYEYKQGSNYEKAQRNIEEVTMLGSVAVQELASLASQAQHPRLYEALTDLLNSVVSANKEMLELEKTQLTIEEKKSGKSKDPEARIVNNTMFVGSTKEILDHIQSKKEEKQ